MGHINIPTGNGEYVEIREPERGDFPGNLNGALQYTLSHFIYKVLDVMGGGLGRFAGSFFVQFLDLIKPELVSYVGPFIDDLLDNPELPPGLRRMLESIKEDRGQAGGALLMGLGSTAGGAAVGSIISSLMSPATYWLNRQLHPARTSPAESYAMLWRGGINDATLWDYLEDQGWAESIITAWGEVLRPRLDPGTLVALMWRGLMGEGEVRNELEKRGYLATDISNMLESSKRIPSPPDLISMAVREAFHPELISKYRYMDAFPGEFATWMEKQGFSRDWAEKWWVAHWRLPGIRDAFEMMHRGEIGEPEIRDLLRTADIAPIWHDPLIAIAYSPYTRVDVRRMHKLGIIDDAGLIKSYKDLGYDDDHAQNMALFTILYNTEDERTASKADILKGYKVGVLRKEEAKQYLLDIGISPGWADYYLSIEELRLAEEVADEEIKTVRELYINGVIARAEAYGRLGLLNLPAARMEKLFELWDIQKERKTQLPTRTELEGFYRLGIVDEGRLRAELSKRGYLPEYVEWYVKNLLMVLHMEAVEAEQKARDEEERVRVRERKTAYDIERSRLDVQIAERKVSKAEDKLLLLEAVTEQQAAFLTKHIVEMDVEIAELAVEKAEAKRELAGG